MPFTLEFEPTEDGTKLTSRGEMAFQGLLKVVEWLLGKQIKNQAQSDFDTLKVLLEGVDLRIRDRASGPITQLGLSGGVGSLR